MIPPYSTYLLRQSVVSLCGNAAAALLLFDGEATRSSESSTLPSSAKVGPSLLCDNKGRVIRFSFQFVISRLRGLHLQLGMGNLTCDASGDRAV